MNLKRNCCRPHRNTQIIRKKQRLKPKNQGSKQAMETNQLKAVFENAEVKMLVKQTWFIARRKAREFRLNTCVMETLNTPFE
jgi:hypothetical protein